MESTNERKSSGVAKAGLTLGIIGTSLAGLLAAGNGNGVGLFGGTNHSEEQQSTISALKSDIAELKAMRYADSVGAEVYRSMIGYSEKTNTKLEAMGRELYSAVAELDKRSALNEQAMILNRQYDNMARDYQFALFDAKLDCCCDKTAMTASFNQQLNELANAAIINYVNSNFIAGQLYLPASSITPPPVTR